MFSGAGISLGGIFAIIVLIGIIIALIVTNIRIVPQANAYVVNPMGFNLVLNKEQIEKIAGISK